MAWINKQEVLRHMARIAGVDLPREKRVEIGLTYIFGIWRSSSNRILGEAKVNPDTRIRDLTDDEVIRLRGVITKAKWWKATCAAKSR